MCWNLMLRSACVTVCLVIPCKGDIITVDDSGGADYTDIQPAINAANDGDIILVRAGGYTSANFRGKGCALIGAGVDLVRVGGQVTIKNLSLGQTVAVSHLMVFNGGSAIPPIAAEDNEGTIVISDVVTCSSLYTNPEGGNYFARCKSVFVSRLEYMTDDYPSGFVPGFTVGLGTRCAMSNSFARGDEGWLGMNPDYPGGDGGTGARVVESQAWLARCTFDGGPGGACGWNPTWCGCYPMFGGEGGSGMFVTGVSSEVIVADDGTHFILGDDGGDGLQGICDPSCWNYGGDGGDGIRLDTGANTPIRVVLSKANVYAGLGGESPTQPGQDGVPYDGDQSRFEFPSDPIPTFAVTGDFLPDGDGTISVYGNSGDFAFLIASDAFDFREIPNTGYFPLIAVPGSFWIFFPAGAIPANGALSIPFKIPDQTGLIGATYALQGFTLPPSGTGRIPQLSNFDTFTVRE